MGARLATHPAFVVAWTRRRGDAAALTRSFDFGDVIVFDMGGTTAKASIIEGGQPAIVSEYEFRDGITSPSRFIKGGGYMLKVPAVDIAEVGAGGGSIAAIDAGGLLNVGPASAGAHPGPACYGLGNDRPTVTDANVCLGFLNPTTLAGGSLSIRKPLAEAAMTAHIAEPLGLPLIEAAHGVRQIANVNMARAIRSVTVERGKDPRDMAMVAFGGGGPLHAVDVARLLGISKVIAPVMSGVFSAAGMLSSDVEHNFVRSTLRPLSRATPEWLAERVRDLAADGRAVLQAEGYDGDNVDLRFAADLRYIGQSSELAIPFDPVAISENLFTDLAQRFNAAYQRPTVITPAAVELANFHGCSGRSRPTGCDLAIDHRCCCDCRQPRHAAGFLRTRPVGEQGRAARPLRRRQGAASRSVIIVLRHHDRRAAMQLARR